jgi:uncharacterized protein (TIGR02271 family)
MGTGMGTARTGDWSSRDVDTSDWNTVGPRYRQTWERQYGTSGRNWTDVEPYYRYSHEMSRDPRYRGRSWSEVESDLHTGYRGWASRSGYRDDDSAWDNVKDSLRDAWDSLTGRGDEHAGHTDRDRERMELREERLDVDKRQVERGEARLRKDVVEERQEIDVPVRREEAYIERRPVSGDRPARGDIGEGEIRVPIRGEQVDVDKETVVREEVELGKRTVQDTERVSDTVRREEARIETEGDVNVRGERASGRTGRQTQPHRHVYDENGRCRTCGKSREELAA